MQRLNLHPPAWISLLPLFRTPLGLFGFWFFGLGFSPLPLLPS